MPGHGLPAMTTLMLACCIAALSAVAGEPEVAPTTAAAAATPESRRDVRCVDVQVNGERVPDYACLGQLMNASPEAAPAPAMPGSERIVRRPPTELGLANRAATRQRLGNAFGVSTRPQRPPPPPPPPAIPGH